MQMRTYNYVTLMDFCQEFGLDTEDVYDMISDSDSVSFGDAYDTLIFIDQLFDVLDQFGMDTEEIQQKLGNKNQNLLISLGS